MSSSDPRLQLYNVAEQSLERMHRDFDRRYNGLLEWTNYYSPQNGSMSQFPFMDPDSSFSADSAHFNGVFERAPGSLDISISLFKSRTPYIQDTDKLTFPHHHYDVVLLDNDGPPLLLSSGFFDNVDYGRNELMHFYHAGIGELLGIDRAQVLINVLSMLSINNLDVKNFDKVKKL